MVVPQKFLLLFAFSYSLLSCGNLEQESHKSSPKNNEIPSFERNQSELPTSAPNMDKPIEKPIKKEEKKKELKALDTLKPVIVVP